MHTILASSAAALMALGHGTAAKPFDSFANSAFAQMNARQAQLIREYNLTSYPQFHWSQKDGELLFTSKGRVKVIASVQFVGDVSKRRHTWLWAWANRSAIPPMKTAVVRVRRYGKRHDYGKLTTAEWKATPLDGWKMAAVAEDVLHAKGVYRSEDATGYTYLVITSIRWANGARSASLTLHNRRLIHAAVLKPSRKKTVRPRIVLAAHRSMVHSRHGRGAKHRNPPSTSHANGGTAHTRRASKYAKHPRVHRA